MKKIVTVALLLIVSVTAFAQINYCTPQAIQQAHDNYNAYLRNNATQRSTAMWLAGSGGPEVLESARRTWQANDQQAWQQTIGLAKMLCEAEMLQLKMQQQYK